MLRRLIDILRGMGQGSGARLFSAFADRARANHRWARSRKRHYRVEDFQVHFPDSRADRLRRQATPVAIAAALLISVGLIGTVTYNILTDPDPSPGLSVAGTSAPEVVEEGSAIAGPVDPLDEPPDGSASLTPAAVPGEYLSPPSAQSEPPEALAAVRQRDRGDMLVVGTGKVTGVYFPTGGAICQLFNAMTIQDGKNHDGENQGGANCTVTSTGGSIDNLNALRRGDLDFALVQSDWQFHAHEGTVRLAAPGAFGDLRALFSIYVEPLTIIARGDSGIRKLDDLPGTRVAMGEPGSGQYEGMKVLMSAMGWSSSDFDYLSTGPASGYLEDLCLGEVDAVVMVAGHPNGATMGITNSCDAVLVDVSGHEIDTLIAAMPYYAKATIPGGFYPGNPDPVASFGVAATVVAAAGLSEETVYALVRAVFENFDTFRVLHPAFNGLAARDMISRALSAPLHEGAVRYYRERGWL